METIADLASADRSCVTELKKKLTTAGLVRVETLYDRKTGLAEVWDVSPLIHLTRETSNEVAFNVARALLQNSVKKRSHKKKPAAPAHEFSEAESPGCGHSRASPARAATSGRRRDLHAAFPKLLSWTTLEVVHRKTLL